MVSLDEARSRLAAAPWHTRSEAQAIMGLLDGAEGRVRVVGGAVRDAILGRLGPETDIDMATELTPDEVSRRAIAAGIAVYPTGIEHGTVTLRLGDFATEVTTLREDVQTDGRHAVVRFGTDWQADAQRRDFTMNALYSGMDGGLFDPLGGIGDCLAGHVRFIGDADRRIAEDRLRVYRFFRFSAGYGGQDLDAEGLSASQRAAGDLRQLSPERVGAEMVRMLALPEIARTLEAMSAADILPLAPETLALLARYEAGNGASLIGRLALVSADIGLETLSDRWRLSNRQAALTSAAQQAIQLLREDQPAHAFYRFDTVFADAVAVAAAIEDWPQERRLMLLHTFNGRAPKFPVGGADLAALGMKPGKSMGEQLARLEARWIDSGFALTREDLLAMAGS